MGSSQVTDWVSYLIKLWDSFSSTFLSLNIRVKLQGAPSPFIHDTDDLRRKRKPKQGFVVKQLSPILPEPGSYVWLNVTELGEVGTTFGARSHVLPPPVFWKTQISVCTLVLHQSIDIQQMQLQKSHSRASHFVLKPSNWVSACGGNHPVSLCIWLECQTISVSLPVSVLSIWPWTDCLIFLGPGFLSWKQK